MRPPRSLNTRLLAFAGAAIAAALVVAWLVLGLLFERHAERQLRAELERHGLALVAALELDANSRPVLTEQPFDPRFNRPSSGLYWRISAPGGELRSRSLWDGDLSAPPPPPALGWGFANAAGPFEARVLVVARDIQLTSQGPQILVEVAGDRQPLNDARDAFGRESAIFLAVLWFALALAAWVQVRLGLTPLDAVRHELDALRRSSSARLSEDGHPLEIRPLTEAINSLADARARDMDRARGRARDLAHALKTPLTALRFQIDSLDPDTVRDMRHSLGLVSGAVEGELARAGGRASASPGVDAATTVERLFAVIARTPDGARLKLTNQLPADVRLPLDEDAALEALGAILENAARHAATAVIVSGAHDGELRLEIADDGPGIVEARRGAALSRGVRLDEGGPRHGLGLSIARDFVEASGGALELTDADGGGLKVILRWPRDPSDDGSVLTA